MTITIHRTIRQQRFVVFLGLVALLGAMAFAVFQDADTDREEATTRAVPAIVVTTDSYSYWERLGSLQDGFLPPTVIVDSNNYWRTLESLQDGYLPPHAASNTDLSLLDDSRTAGPR